MTQRYLTNRGEGLHILEADNAGVDGPESEVIEVEIVVGFDNTDYTYNPVMDPIDHEQPRDGLSDKEVPRHDAYASEYTGLAPDVVLPGGITNAHPDWTVGEVVNTVPDGAQAQADAVAEGDHVNDGPGVVEPEGVPEQQNEPDVGFQPAEDRPELEPEGADLQPEAPVSVESQVTPVKPPANNGSAAEWRAYAVSQGMDPVQADNLGRDEIRAQYAGS